MNNRLYFFVLFAFTLSINNFSFAQNYRYKIFNTENSFLPQNQVTAIFQDSKGNLWIGTKFGVVKYDGKNYKIYTAEKGILSGDVTGIFELSNGTILLCAPFSGISKIKGDSISTYPIPEQYQNMNFHKIGDSLIINARTYKKTYTSRLLFFNGKQYKEINHKTYKGSINGINYRNDTLWTLRQITNKKYFFGFLDKNFHFHKLSLKEDFYHFIIKENIMYLSRLSGLYQYQKGKLQKLIDWKGYYGIIHGKNSIYVTAVKNINRIKEYDYSVNLLDSFNIPGFKTMIEDREQNLWFASEQGLYKLSNRAFRHYVFADYHIKPVYPEIIYAMGEYWLSSFDGNLYQFKNKQFINYRAQLPNKNIAFMIGRCVKLDGTIIWGAQGRNRYEKGLLIKKEDKFKALLKGYAAFYSFYYDTLQNILLGGYGQGLLILDDDFSIKAKIDTVKKLKYPTGIEKDTAGYYWLSTRRSIYKYLPEKNYLKQINIPVLEKGALQILHDSRHNLWFGGEGGLIFYNNKNFKQIKHNALKNKAITALHETKNGILLIGTTSGLVTLDLQQFYRNHKTIMKVYDADNGFSGLECAQSGFTEDDKGLVWIALADRLVSIDPEKLDFKNVPVEPYISSVSVLNEAKWLSIDTSLHQLKYDEDKIRFEFSGPYFSNPVLYSYKLEGFDKDWSEYDKVNQAVYTNLPHGKYVFKVKALNGDEGKTAMMTSYAFTKKPAFWETVWFYVFVLLLGILVIWLFIIRMVQVKVQKQRLQYEQNKLLLQAQMAQLDPHFIFNMLTTTGNFALKLKQLGLYDIIVRFSRLLQSHWGNKELTRTLGEEINFIKEYCELNKINKGEIFDYKIEYDENVKLDIPVLKLSIQNFVENAIKYGIKSDNGKKGFISVKISQNDEYTYVNIEDEGIGYKASMKNNPKKKRTGIKTLKSTFNLYNLWNKNKLSFELIDKSDIDPTTSGTIVKIVIPHDYSYVPE